MRSIYGSEAETYMREHRSRACGDSSSATEVFSDRLTKAVDVKVIPASQLRVVDLLRQMASYLENENLVQSVARSRNVKLICIDSKRA